LSSELDANIITAIRSPLVSNSLIGNIKQDRDLCPSPSAFVMHEKMKPMLERLTFQGLLGG
jgi:hypothetical protein